MTVLILSLIIWNPSLHNACSKKTIDNKELLFPFWMRSGRRQKYLDMQESRRELTWLASSQFPSSMRRWSGRSRLSVGATPSSGSFSWQASTVKLYMRSYSSLHTLLSKAIKRPSIFKHHNIPLTTTRSKQSSRQRQALLRRSENWASCFQMTLSKQHSTCNITSIFQIIIFIMIWTPLEGRNQELNETRWPHKSLATKHELQDS